MYLVCAIFSSLALIFSSASTLSLPEPYTLLSYTSSPNLDNIHIPDGFKTQNGFRMNIEIGNPEQGMTSHNSADDAGSIYVTVLLPSGTVRWMVIPVSGRSMESRNLCLNSGSTPLKDLKTILVSDMKIVKNVTTKIEESSCEYDEPIISGDCTTDIIVAVIVPIFVAILILATIYIIIKCKEKKIPPESTKAKSDIEIQTTPTTKNKIKESVPEQIKTQDTKKNEAYTPTKPRDEFNTIEICARICPENPTASNKENQDSAENKIKRILETLHLKWKHIKFKNEGPVKKGKPITIHYIVYLDGGEESLEKFVAKVKEGPNQTVIRLNVNVRVSVKCQSKEIAESKIKQVLQNHGEKSHFKYHSQNDHDHFLFNVDLKGDKDEFKLFKEELQNEMKYPDEAEVVEIGTWDFVDVKVTLQGLRIVNKENDVKKSLREIGARGEVNHYGQDVLPDDKHDWKYNVKLYGDINTYEKFRDNLDFSYNACKPRAVLGKF